MNASEAKALAPLVEAAIGGRFIREVSSPAPFFLGLVFSAGETLGLCCRPDAFHLGLCSWPWPDGAVPDILRARLKSARVERAEPVADEPVLKLVMAGGGVLVCEGLGRAANLLLLSEEGAVLWAARRFKGEFRTGACGEIWAPPPPRQGVTATSPEGDPERYFRETASEAIRAALVDAGRRRAMQAIQKRTLALQRRLKAVEADRFEGRSWAGLEAAGKALLSQKDLGRRGLSKAEVMDYEASPPKTVTVELDPSMSLKENAARFFRLAKRGKARIEKTAAILASIARDEAALALEREAVAAESDLSRLFPKPAKATSREKAAGGGKLPKGVTKLDLPQGFTGYAGKTAQANDFVTFRIGRGEDFWFHAADYPGCHVVVRNPSRLEECPYGVAQAAALFAARHSKAPQEGRVAVVFARCKNLRRVPRCVGMVTMARSRTLDVELKGRG